MTLVHGSAAASEVSKADFEERERAEGESLRRVDNKDGTWSYALPATFDPDVLVKGALFVERYDGQESYPWELAQTGARTLTGVVPGATQSSAIDRIQRGVRVDRLGRRWKVVSVDVDAWDAAVAADPGTQGRLGPSVAEQTFFEAPDDDLPPGTEVSWVPFSWSDDTCSGGVMDFVWDTDGRTALNHSALTDRQKTVVKLVHTSGRMCSAVVIRPRHVLTAAHCFYDNSGNALTKTAFSVCRQQDSACLAVEDAYLPEDYTWTTNQSYDDDWAVVRLVESWTAAGHSTQPNMDLSSHSDSTLQSLDSVRNISLPNFVSFPNACTVNTVLRNNIESESIAAVNATHLRFKVDVTSGQSGSPFFFCPDGDVQLCSSGEKGHVYSVLSGARNFFPSTFRVVGPKVSAFRSEAIGFIDN